MVMGGGVPMFGGGAVRPAIPAAGCPSPAFPRSCRTGSTGSSRPSPSTPSRTATFTYGKAGEDAQKLSLREPAARTLAAGLLAAVVWSPSSASSTRPARR